MPRPHPINRLLGVAGEIRAVARELDESDSEMQITLVHWAREIERSVEDVRATGQRHASGRANGPAEAAG